MAELPSTPQLKRKREPSNSQRKKAKTQRKSKAGTGEDADNELIEEDVETAVVNVDKNAEARETLDGAIANGVHEHRVAASSTRKDRKSKDSNPDNPQELKPSASSIEIDQIPSISRTSLDNEQTPSKKTSKKDNKRKNKQRSDVVTGEEEADTVATAAVDESTKDSNTSRLGKPATNNELSLNSNQVRHDKPHHRHTKKDKTQQAKASGLKESTGILARHKASSKGLGKKEKSKWMMSTPIGGWFLPHDPVFSSDEKYLFLANGRALQIYSTETSLLVRTLPIGTGLLSAYAVSATKLNHVYVANTGGLITLWDWSNGNKLGRWDIGAKTRQVAAVAQPDTDLDLLYCHEVGSSHIINVHALRTKDQASQTELKRILKSKSPISGFQVLVDGKIIVVTTSTSVLIGKRLKLHKTALRDFEYAWRELKTPKPALAFSAYVRTQEIAGKGKQAPQDPRDHLDLAFGDEEGAIHVFEDILSTFARIERNRKEGDKSNATLESFMPRRLHWHRQAVGAIKWSRDGNYLLSGGDETVLVIWQLSTGKQQHLPHLTASIENIVVSPTGTSYSVSLANNSVIVLSTTELEAKTNIIGIQSRRVDASQISRESSFRDSPFDVLDQVPLAINPKSPSQILFSVPSSQPRKRYNGVPPEPYVQTFDIATQRPILRQALTRNNATDPNMGPEGAQILEPDIRFIQLSRDGNWMASVDEWVPLPKDLAYLDEGVPEADEEERTFRREVYLKFWGWDGKKAQWALSSRVDAPHFFANMGATARVFDLIPDPSGPGFVTVGEDRFIRIWRPKTRLRDGTIVRGADKSDGTGIVNWTLEASIELSSNLEALEPIGTAQDLVVPRSCQLAFSADGSALAVSVSWRSESDPGVIHIIDPRSGIIRRSITELNAKGLARIGILGSQLIAVGDRVAVWDLVTDELVYSIPLLMDGVHDSEKLSLTRLAVNESDGTFAVALTRFKNQDSSKSKRSLKDAFSKIYVFDPHQVHALWSTTTPETIMSLVAALGGKGYIALDSLSCIRVLTPGATLMQLTTPPPEPAPKTINAGNQIQDDEYQEEGSVVTDSSRLLEAGEDLIRGSDNDKPIVRPEQLQEIFDIGPSHALPPVKDLLSAVVDLYARKPRAVGTA